jgi:hypothetical protein
MSTIIAMTLMAIILMNWGNKEEEICYPVGMKSQYKLLANGEETSTIPAEKKFQIVSQNETHVSIVMPCSSSVIDESGNTFRIEGLYDLNFNESRSFGYIDTFTIWRGEKCCGPYPDWSSSQQLRNHSKKMKDSPVQ